MKSLIARTRELFAAGMPLATAWKGRCASISSCSAVAGWRFSMRSRHSGYNTLERRPAISKCKQLGLLGGALVRRAFTRGRRDADGSALQRQRELPKAWMQLPSGVRTMRSSRESDAVLASYAECNRIARAARSSFYLAFFGLPKRNAMRFARSMRSCGLWMTSRTKPAISNRSGGGWRIGGQSSMRLQRGRTDGHAIFPALADTIARFEIPTRYFHDLISGAEMDLTVASYATFDRLSEYCYRVAGTVGLTCLHVFGFRDPRSPDLAERLGLAFQLTNIIRDVRADFEMGRVYLPDEDLERFGCAHEELRGPVTAAAAGSAGIRGGTRVAALRRRRAACGSGGCGQPGDAVRR